jgi:hypothetical protein
VENQSRKLAMLNVTFEPGARQWAKTFAAESFVPVVKPTEADCRANRALL